MMKTKLFFSLSCFMIFLSGCDTPWNMENVGKNTFSPNMMSISFDFPVLLLPAEGDVLDNGRTDGKDSIIWDFDWTDVRGETAYHLYVIHEGSIYPVIDRIINSSCFQWISKGYIACINRFDWKWKVRTYRDGEYGEWSGERTFSVEPENTDPPSDA